MHEVVPGALADGVEGCTAVHGRDPSLSEPHDSRNGPRRLTKCGRPKEVWHDDVEREFRERGEIKWQLVDVLDHDVIILPLEGAPDRTTPPEGERVATATAVHGHPLDVGRRLAAGPSRGDQRHPVSPFHQTPENLEEM